MVWRGDARENQRSPINLFVLSQPVDGMASLKPYSVAEITDDIHGTILGDGLAGVVVTLRHYGDH